METSTRDVIQIHVDSIQDGVAMKRCPKCDTIKPLNDFGLRRKTGAAANGADVIAAQSWCRPCRTASWEKSPS